MKFSLYDPQSLEYIGDVDASLDWLASEQEGHDVYVVPANSLSVQPDVEKLASGLKAVANPRLLMWEYMEDHRRDAASGEGGTPYWLPEDEYNASPRYMTTLGPLPKEALLERPPLPLELVKEQKKKEIRRAYDEALGATMTMPSESPLANEVAVAAMQFMQEDAEGCTYVMSLLAQRRDDFLRAVDAAQSSKDVAKIIPIFPF